ncbi:MAG: cobyric acid synthase [Anaerolineales bacterium]|nr:cobyric acid synthase [Anaerolineales bacterium]
MPGKVLVVLGTSSSAGKSLMVTGLCRLFARRGVRVAPYKAQNMSNNAAVCPDGGEIGRAQATQAFASGLQPHVDMNPVLIKPEADSMSQVILLGQPWKRLTARAYYPEKDVLWQAAVGALDRLREKYELVIVEGAGSAAELNLREGDIVNMAIALYAQAPVLLVGDIDRGGIFAQLLGTLWLLEGEERELVKGLIVNKFRGDIELFKDGVQILADRGNAPVLGVVPYLHDLHLPEEDAVALESPRGASQPKAGQVEIAVLHLPRIANFDDFDPLAREHGVALRYVNSPQEFGEPQAVIIPGTKSTSNDLQWLRTRGLDERVLQFAEKGGAVVGICGGYQMLGEIILDPDQIESGSVEFEGLGLLPVRTRFAAGKKDTHQVQVYFSGGAGWLSGLQDRVMHGYEIHMGQTSGEGSWLQIRERDGRPVHKDDGAMSPDGRVWGCYLHGLFENQDLRQAWLRSLGWKPAGNAPVDYFTGSLERLADTLEASLNMELLRQIVERGGDG